MSSSFLRERTSLALVCACMLAAPLASLSAQTVIATIPVPGFVGGGAIDPQTKRAYIPTGNNGGVSAVVTVMNERTNKIAATINLPTSWPAVSAALDPFTGRLYVGTENGGLYVINSKTYATVGFINVTAVSVALNPATNKIYVSDFNSTLYVIDGETDNIETTISINAIENIAVNPFTNRIYAAEDNFPGSVAVVDGATNQVIAQPKAGSGLSFGTAVDPIFNTFYSFEQFGTATAYSGKTNTQTASIQVPGQPSGIADDPFTHTLYVSQYQSGSVAVINGSTNTLTGSFLVGSQPQYLTDDPANKLLYVGIQGPPDSNGFPTFFLVVVKTN